MPVVTFPSAANSPLAATVISLGKVYIGVVDENPRVLANRINVTIIQQDGTPVVIAPAAQPFVLNAGGMFTYDGSVVILTASESYSMAVDTSQDVQVYYLPDSATLSADVNTDLVSLTERSGDPTPAANIGKLYTMDVGGITEFFYMDSAGNTVQLTNAGSINIDLESEEVTAAIINAVEQVTGLQFRGELVELEIDGDGNVEMDVTRGSAYSLTLDQNVNTFSLTNAPAGRVPDMGLSIISTGAFTITTFQANTPGATIWIPDSVTSLQPSSSATTSYGIKLFANAEFHIFPVLMQQII